MEDDDDDENATEVAESDGAALELERGTHCRCGGAYGGCTALDVLVDNEIRRLGR